MESFNAFNINHLINAVKAAEDGNVSIRIPNPLDNETPTYQNYRLSDLVNDKEAAKILGVSENTLAVWRSAKRYGLRFYKVGGRVRYRVSDLVAWLESRSCSEGVTP